MERGLERGMEQCCNIIFLIILDTARSVLTRSKSLKIGILIIGSLFWDNGRGDVRKDWREDRLRINEAIDVSAPIRYGRKSSSRGDTYTMVLSMKAQLGRAKLVPCATAINDSKDLIDEAVHLWSAESQRVRNSEVSDTWGCVGLKIRDGVVCPDEIRAQWAQVAQDKAEHFNIRYADDELPLLNNSGIVQMAWPTKADGEPLLEVDALLVSTNQPTLTPRNQYADPYDIARAWLRCPKHDHYFYKNKEYGIKTFEDDAILEEIWAAHHGGCGGPIVC